MMTRIYILSGPDGVVRYVGKTSQSLADRLKTHFAQARSKRAADHLNISQSQLSERLRKEFR